MNTLFKKQGNIILDSNYSLETDKANGVQLRFVEMRTREKLDKNKKKTGETEEFEFVDIWYFLKVGQALSKYVELVQSSAKNLEQLIEKTEKIEKIVQDFRDNYRNW